ncbi:hypothetical protein [Cumulibacter soli]|uniref:hypothetical protein n=1 Tax=Cumulibacter soli TaxID=2546344 RepID=UPI0010677034|nr:hypothetical protein [Cumulibacter soli]
MSDTHHDYDAGPHVRQRDYEPSRVDELLTAHAVGIAIDAPEAALDVAFLEAPALIHHDEEEDDS